MSSVRIVDLRGRSPRAPQGPRLPFREKEKRSPLRARRRKLRALGILIVLVVLAALAYGISFASYLPQLTIQSIEVAGAEQTPPGLIRAYVETKLYDGAVAFFSRTNIFLYPRAGLEKAIKEYFPRIRTAKVSRASLLATAVEITVGERKQFALWCPSTSLRTSGGEENCYSMDEGGFVFAPAPSSTPAEYAFSGGLAASSTPVGQTFLPGHFVGILALLQRLGQAGFAARGADIENGQDFSVPLVQGFSLRASFGADVEGLIRNLQLVLSSDPLRGKESELEYIDLRFGNRVYYKLKGEVQQSAQ